MPHLLFQCCQSGRPSGSSAAMGLLWMLAKRHGRVYHWSTNVTRTATNTIQRPRILDYAGFWGLGCECFAF